MKVNDIQPTPYRLRPYGDIHPQIHSKRSTTLYHIKNRIDILYETLDELKRASDENEVRIRYACTPEVIRLLEKHHKDIRNLRIRIYRMIRKYNRWSDSIEYWVYLYRHASDKISDLPF